MFLDGPKSPADLWSNEEFWPREDRRFYFGARAFNMIGRSLYAEQWSGLEGHTTVIHPLPENPSAASDWERSVAVKIIKDRYPDALLPTKETPVAGTLGALGSSLLNLGRSFPAQTPQSFDPEHWSFAQRVWSSHLDRRKPVLDRKKAVVEWIVEKAHDDKALRMVVVDKRNLYPFLDHPEHWNLKWDRLEKRWLDCAYNPGEPSNPYAEPVAWIMVFREDLDRLLHGLANPQQGSLALGDCSENGAGDGAITTHHQSPDKQAYWRAHASAIFADAAAYIAEHGDTTRREPFVEAMFEKWPGLSLTWMRDKVWTKAITDAEKPHLSIPGNRRGSTRKNKALR